MIDTGTLERRGERDLSADGTASSGLNEPPYTGTVRTVVWEDGGRDSVSNPIFH